MAKANYHTTSAVVLRFCTIFLKIFEGFSKISEPLHALTWKGISFVWGES